MVMVYVIVLVRYRNLIPLMWALMVVEVFFRLGVGLIHPLTPDYYMRTPPGKLGNLPMLAIGFTMLVLAVRNTMRRTGPPA
jgi:hypothetical protein